MTTLTKSDLQKLSLAKSDLIQIMIFTKNDLIKKPNLTHHLFSLHICLLCATSVHAHLAKRMLKLFPKLINDIYISDEYYGKYESLQI